MRPQAQGVDRGRHRQLTPVVARHLATPPSQLLLTFNLQLVELQLEVVGHIHSGKLAAHTSAGQVQTDCAAWSWAEGASSWCLRSEAHKDK